MGCRKPSNGDLLANEQCHYCGAGHTPIVWTDVTPFSGWSRITGQLVFGYKNSQQSGWRYPWEHFRLYAFQEIRKLRAQRSHHDDAEFHDKITQYNTLEGSCWR